MVCIYERKYKMKNLLNILAVALVAVSVVACSEKQADNSSAKAEPVSEPVQQPVSMK